MEDVLRGFVFETSPADQPAIIKVIGVGGGGGNAVKNMYEEGLKAVTFALCNTDKQALLSNKIPVKLQLGKTGLGAGADPVKGKEAAEENLDDIKKMLEDGTKMVLITAGMGKGTGTGAAPVVAKIAKEMDILTIGIVTIPFRLEGEPKILKALRGVEELRKNVDALVVINNQKLIEIYGNMPIVEAYKKADGVLAVAAKSIAEMITIEGIENVDFADVATTLKNGGIAVMNNGYASGEGRVYNAFDDALHSPLLNNSNVYNAKKIVFVIYSSSSHPLLISEMKDVEDLMLQFDKNIHTIHGIYTDDSLGDKVKVSVLASGFDLESINDSYIQEVVDKESKKDDKQVAKQAAEDENLIKKYYGGDSPKTKVYEFKSIQELDNDVLIEALLNTPTFERNPNTLRALLSAG
ncbi:cell division protein FtsZ [Bacteroidia bacterium]|nr:cell division protein FtsZ [Bacteroidia bacterium]